ncbi:nucleotidyltransferase domain-containing protein [Niabella beijingensis]|uniref:nucleotidyltransferase domain-containing protein n=1 Tax=Niabella beijingensis TaxID=2872700 RepID=UPI001CBF42B6|nr:nucleotidyltransferase domain-containing protein [Niabella beijingensis]MBZ4189229.1 nucleotidyltransferase domain-containing protein [Niabella beijingensis]
MRPVIEEQMAAAGIRLLPEKQELLVTVTTALADVKGVAAIVLGGSYAQGTATDTSDMDIGIYYTPADPFDTRDIREIARDFATEAPTVTGFYEWGPWVNGGAWIHTRAGKVDFLYRNIEQVTRTIGKAQNGEWEHHFEQQPPYGFSSVIYLAETKYCIPLLDPSGIIRRLKKAVAVYPFKLKETVIGQSLWSAAFTLWNADHFARSGDVYNTAGCLTRAVKNIVDALFALNEQYPMGDKRAVAQLEKMPLTPANLKEKIEQVLGGKNSPGKNVALLDALHKEVTALAGNLYQPLFRLP